MVSRARRLELLSNVIYGHYNFGPGKITFACADDKETGLIYFGVSFCSPKDSFRKKFGREQAYIRLTNVMRTIVDENFGGLVKRPENIRRGEVADFVMNYLEKFSDVVLPNWAWHFDLKTNYYTVHHGTRRTIRRIPEVDTIVEDNPLVAQGQEYYDSMSYGEEFGADYNPEEDTCPSICNDCDICGGH